MKSSINRDGLRKNFWTKYALDELTKPEWEALCDGCGRCCLIKLEHDNGDIDFTNVACRLLDDKTCACGQYALRKQLVAGCVVLSPENIERIAHWMPATCAYRLRFEGKPLFDWHPLISGNSDTVHTAGISMAGRVLAEYEVDEDDLENHIISGIA